MLDFALGHESPCAIRYPKAAALEIAGARSPVARVDLPELTLERPLWRVQRGDSFAAPLLRQACAALDAALASLA